MKKSFRFSLFCYCFFIVTALEARYYMNRKLCGSFVYVFDDQGNRYIYMSRLLLLFLLLTVLYSRDSFKKDLRYRLIGIMDRNILIIF